MNINWDEVDKLSERKPYFDVGTYKVTITDIDLEENTNKNQYFKVTAEGEGGEETDRISLFLTDKALPWTMSLIQGILVHNAKNDKAKEEAKKYLHSVKKADDLDPHRIIGAQAWLKVTRSDRQFTRDDGSTGYYNDFQLLSYEPKQSKEEAVAELLGSGDPVEFTDEVPFK